MIQTLVLAPLALLAACTTTTPAGPAEEGPSAASPADGGTNWAFVTIDGRPPLSNRNVLTISENRIAANVGCNSMGGELDIEPGRLKVTRLVATLMYCEGLMQQEQAVADLLDAQPAFYIEGDRLFIRSDLHQAELTMKRTR